MSRTLRLAVAPSLILLVLGLIAAAGVSLVDDGDPKHPDALSRFRLWSGVVLLGCFLPLLVAAPAAVSLRCSLGSLSARRYLLITVALTFCALIMIPVAVYAMVYIKPAWLAATIGANALIVAGFVCGRVLGNRAVVERT
jgi:hypothetical protein